jgi:hypothetical protein
MNKNVKIALSTFLTFAFIVGISPANSSTPALLNQPWQGIKIIENEQFLQGQAPQIIARYPSKDGDFNFYFCGVLTDETCTASNNIESWASLPYCDAVNTINCLSNVYAVNETGTRIDGTFVKAIAEEGKTDYQASPSQNIPLGKGQGGIWKIPGVLSDSGKDDYFVGVILRSALEKKAGDPIGSGKFQPFYFASAIAPVNEVKGNFGPTYNLQSFAGHVLGGSGFGAGNPSTDAWERCVVTDKGVCYNPGSFPSGYRFGISVKLSAKLAGWFHGRISEPKITSSLSEAGQTINIEALPVIVPTLWEKVATTDISDELRTLLTSGQSFSNGQGNYTPGSYGDPAFEMASPWIKMLKDKASTSNTYWSVRTLTGNEAGEVYRCTKSSSELAGVITTNSLVYSAGPPAFNKADETLDYKLLSPHYSANGDVAKGSYDLLLRADVARCIYGFSKAPISASISIVSADGTAQVSTTVLNEKNGWLTLSAKNFTFSSPVVRIKLTQEAVVVAPTPTPTASAKPVAAKKTSITCVKGKATKKVTAVNPKCPTGYKKK